MARNAIQVGVESYGLKRLERLTTFQRGHDIEQGAGAVVEYERFLADQNPAALERIAAYNEDDVRAAQALRDWLIEHRPAGTPWRAAQLEADPGIPELTSRSPAFMASVQIPLSTCWAMCWAIGFGNGALTSPPRWPNVKQTR